MALFKRQPHRYVFKGVRDGDVTLQEGDTLSVEAWGVTIVVCPGGVFDVRPLMTDEQIDERTMRDLRVKYNLKAG